ncbi:MAG: MATE family efflux transporter [Elusimicrobiota bacterium]|jgi:MATE family multidrug resistance protein|nr:MATE family efflux transporter [Elusimicrobiota bacterium]
MKIFSYFTRQFYTSGGYYEFLKIAFPLIVSMGIGAVQLFVDRIFLAWYSTESFAASVPAGVSNFAIVSLFLGALSYINVFVSQYYGKGEYRSIGPAIWQSVFLCFGAALIMLVLSFFSNSIFEFMGHPALLVKEEGDFFRVMCYGAFPAIAASVFSGFYSGRGRTGIVLLISTVGVCANIVLDYLLIFGNFGFPERGIAGAAEATNWAALITFAIYMLLVLSKKNADIYNTRFIRLDFSFMKRLLKFGIPNGVQFFFDMAGFSIFVLIIGSLGTEALAANNIALNTYNLAYMPLIGSGIALSVMVGKYLGKNKVSLAQASVRSAVQIVCLYMFFVAIVMTVFPEKLVTWFLGGSEVISIEQIIPMSIVLLRINAAFLIFDAINVVFSAAIKGAGDTAFVMKTMILVSIFIIIIPIYLIVSVFNLGLYAAWTAMIVYIAVLAGTFYLRYKSNKWKKMRVINMDIAEE